MNTTNRLIPLLFVGALACSLPVKGSQGARSNVLGTVAQADHARLANVPASAGADVYACDPLETDEGGLLRVQVGTSQIYLGPSSASQLESEANEVRALVMRGTLTFSIPASSNFSIETPAGILRAESGQPAAGQVVVTGPHGIVVSASRGSLLLDTGGEFRTVAEGQSARIEFDSTIEAVCSNKREGNDPPPQKALASRKKLGFYVIMGTATVVPGYFIWQELTESESKPQR